MSGFTEDSVHYWKGRALAAERQRDDLRTRLMLAEEAAESEAGERAEAERERDQLLSERETWLSSPATSARLVDEKREAERERNELRAAVERLVDKWRYKGGFGWGPWQEGHGPDHDGEVLDHCAAELNRVLTIHNNEGERNELRAAVERTRETLAHLEGQRMRDWQERRAGGGNPNIHQSYYLGQSDAYGDALERLSRETRGLR